MGTPDDTTNEPPREPSEPPGRRSKDSPAPKSSIWRQWLEPLKHPTGKQKEAYARFLHTLSAACFVGSVTVAYNGRGDDVLRQTAVLGVLGVVFFLAAAPMSNGE